MYCYFLSFHYINKYFYEVFIFLLIVTIITIKKSICYFYKQNKNNFFKEVEKFISFMN